MENLQKSPSLDLSLAERVVKAREAESAAKEIYDTAKKEKEQAERELLDEMVELELPGFKYRGKSFSPRTTTFYSIIGGEEDNEKMCNLLRENGLESLIKTKIHGNTLGSTIKNDLTDEKGNIPDWLSGMVNKYDKTILVLTNSK